MVYAGMADGGLLIGSEDAGQRRGRDSRDGELDPLTSPFIKNRIPLLFRGNPVLYSKYPGCWCCYLLPNLLTLPSPLMSFDTLGEP